MVSVFEGVVVIIMYALGSLSTVDTTCTDVKDDCRSYGASVCVDYAQWAKINCNYTCKFCTGPPPVTPCKDVADDCTKYASDLCQNPSYKVWAEDHCRQFCGFCSDVTTTAVKTTVKTTPTPISGIPTGVCIDTVNFCLVYSKAACNDATWADSYCRKWCGRC